MKRFTCCVVTGLGLLALAGCSGDGEAHLVSSDAEELRSASTGLSGYGKPVQVLVLEEALSIYRFDGRRMSKSFTAPRGLPVGVYAATHSGWALVSPRGYYARIDELGLTGARASWIRAHTKPQSSGKTVRFTETITVPPAGGPSVALQQGTRVEGFAFWDDSTDSTGQRQGFVQISGDELTFVNARDVLLDGWEATWERREECETTGQLGELVLPFVQLEPETGFGFPERLNFRGTVRIPKGALGRTRINLSRWVARGWMRRYSRGLPRRPPPSSSL